MTKKWRIPVVLLLVAIAAVTIHVAHREPSYEGRSLSSWLKDLNSETDDANQTPAQEAIRHIGTNALPYLLKELCRKDSPGKTKLMEWNDRLESDVDHSFIKLTPADDKRDIAVEAFRALGSNAVSAIPAICHNLNDEELATQSATVLAFIGEAALPSLKEQLNTTNDFAREACAAALLIFTNATDVVPTLQKLTTDIQPDIRATAAHGLGQFAYAPETSVPLLVGLLSDTNVYVQSSACLGLAAFGTNALPAAPALSNLFVSNLYGDPSLRRASGWALRRTGPSSIPLFLKLLAHPNSQICAEAVRALAGAHDEATNHLPEILSLLRNPERNVRLSVLMALRTFRAEPSPLMPVLIETLRVEDDEHVLQQLCTMLGQFGTAATNALPVLMERAGTSKEDSRLFVLWTIAAIDEDAAKKVGAEKWLLDNVRAQKARARNDTNATIEPHFPPAFDLPPSP